MKFKLKIICPECGGSMQLRSFDNNLICTEYDNHKDNRAEFRLIGSEDIVFELLPIEGDPTK